MRSKLKMKVDRFFKDSKKTDLWFKTKNPSLGGVAPNWMIRAGRMAKLERFIDESLEENELHRLKI